MAFSYLSPLPSQVLASPSSPALGTALSASSPAGRAGCGNDAVGMWHSAAAQLQPIPLGDGRGEIKHNVPLAKLTSFKVGGPAQLYAAPRSDADLHASLQWAKTHEVPVTLLGAGTNLLISDRGLSGLVIATRYLRHMEFDDERGQLVAGAGEPIARLAWKAAERGLSGLEWAAGIPGTVGGAVVMNAGAHRLCAADIVTHAHILTPTGDAQTLSNQQLGFQYRTSILQGSPLLVTQATFQLEGGHDPKEVLARTRSFLDYRHTTQPYDRPNCGSVFRNPEGHSAGWLIENSGLKGYQIGEAQVAERHANFIVNLGHATAKDIRALIEHVQYEVEQQWGLQLHPEVKFMGQF